MIVIHGHSLQQYGEHHLQGIGQVLVGGHWSVMTANCKSQEIQHFLLFNDISVSQSLNVTKEQHHNPSIS
jgi:hypothetical protein